MNFIKRTKKNMVNFFEDPISFNIKESIWGICIFVFFVIFSIMIFLPFSLLAAKISLSYFASCFLSLMMAVNIDADWAFDVSFHYSFLYLLMMMLSFKIVGIFVPYRGDDPMMIRAYKVRYFKRKAKINKLKFWK